ncbi:DUF2406 domain-containing protein ASCRUDRAFT_8111 [Ascoidea rubescens DSM 1968]|uniref:Uncharacterized protein n=1 Tax=Ascoidea rubescens DSM 1968 TaxID=1344418 RepID=A0A1D2VI59_9ASCO|nr:hypothetical protein ASCRUDRAFT_8111 [Ascoidea rubescens DSM 1968]ODV61167.1 hypothetical protein ASCRUDRAFT_8111 [Ascoidea rubescens DSM 1968]
MAVFGGKSPKKNNRASTNSIKLTKADKDLFKNRNSRAQDMMNAINEDQPFQQASDQFDQGKDNGDSMGNFSKSNGINDVFGNPITVVDMSNPTRSRDERPLDTIRSFEFSISGDSVYREQLETARYGFRPRPEFPLLKGNPYANTANTSDSIYVPAYKPPPTTAPAQKKKRGFFGKKKK